MHASKLYKHICKEKNCLYLNSKNVLQPKVLKVITNFLREDEKVQRFEKQNFELQKNLSIFFNQCFSRNSLLNRETWFRFKKVLWEKTLKTMKTYAMKQTFTNKKL